VKRERRRTLGLRKGKSSVCFRKLHFPSTTPGFASENPL